MRTLLNIVPVIRPFAAARFGPISDSADSISRLCETEDGWSPDHLGQVEFAGLGGSGVSGMTHGSQASTTLYSVDPLQDARWGMFIQRNDRASVFHSVPWLDAIRRTYGYHPVVYTTSPPGTSLQDGVVFDVVDSSLTGRRLVSLPFSDHCEPLVKSWEDLKSIVSTLQRHCVSERWKYIEVRPVNDDLFGDPAWDGLSAFKRYYLHRVDLLPTEEELLNRFHRTSIRGRIRKAQRNGLTYETGRSNTLLKKFYHLILLTRRRHGVPPQPEAWFRTLLDAFGDSLQIHVAFHKKVAVAAILTLRFKNVVTYKYGGSDQTYHELGSFPFVLWMAMRDAKLAGAHTFDLGRTDCSNEGLTRFKDRWASRRSSLVYWRNSASARSYLTGHSVFTVARNVFRFLPPSLQKIAGVLLYRHIG